MSATVAAYIRQHHLALLCLFLILSGGTAYATHPGGANTISSGDIINDEVRTQDIAAGHVTSQDIGTGEVLSEDIGNGQVALGDLAANSVNSGKLVEGGVQGSDVLNDSLTGDDVQESSLFNDNSLKGADIDEGSLNGALIPGIATSGLVKSSGVVRVDDPAGDGQWTVVPLLTSGPFTITGECENAGVSPEDGSVAVNSLVWISSSVGPWSVDSDANFGIDEATNLSAGRQVLAASANTDPVLDVGDYAAATSGRLLAGEALAGGKIMGTDCVFGVTGIG